MFTRQVNNGIHRNIQRTVLRNTHTAPSPKVLYNLDKRGLLRVRGVAANGFLQGLITNDMRHLKDGMSCIYAMFLNTKGRVLYDTMVHNTAENDSYILECDALIVDELRKYLTLYRLRKKIDIDNISDESKLYSLLSNITPIDKENLLVHKDPRINTLGYRIIAPAASDDNELMTNLGENVVLGESDDYKYLLYSLGVAEGVDDLPPGSCIPLEANCDYLHGVSFHKGCYIGQELTARVHHTGVVRKRFMPFKFERAPETPVPSGTIITAVDSSDQVGKVRGVTKDYGLIVANITEALKLKTLQVSGYKGVVERPDWWPVEAPKEKAGATRAI